MSVSLRTRSTRRSSSTAERSHGGRRPEELITWATGFNVRPTAESARWRTDARVIDSSSRDVVMAATSPLQHLLCDGTLISCQALKRGDGGGSVEKKLMEE